MQSWSRQRVCKSESPWLLQVLQYPNGSTLDMNVWTWINAHTHFLPHSNTCFLQLVNWPEHRQDLSDCQNLLLLYMGILWKALPRTTLHIHTHPDPHTHTSIHTSTNETLFNYDVCRCSKANIVTNNKKGVLCRYNTRNTIRTSLHGQHRGSLTPLILLAERMLQFHEIYSLHRAQFMASFQRVWGVPNSLMKNSWARTWVKTSVHTLERKGHILCVEPIVSPISLFEMFPEGLMLVLLTVLILFLLKDFSTRWDLQ